MSNEVKKVIYEPFRKDSGMVVHCQKLLGEAFRNVGLDMEEECEDKFVSMSTKDPRAIEFYTIIMQRERVRANRVYNGLDSDIRSVHVRIEEYLNRG